MGNYTDGYRNLVKRYLEPLSSLLQVQLQTIFNYRFPRAARLKIAVSPNELSGKLPLTAFCTDESGSQILHSSGAFPMRLVGQVEHIIPPAETHLVTEYEQAGVETVEVELQTLIEWFAGCWVQAGGLDFPLPATIGVRGDIEVFDLKRQEWVYDPQTARQKNANKEINW